MSVNCSEPPSLAPYRQPGDGSKADTYPPLELKSASDQHCEDTIKSFQQLLSNVFAAAFLELTLLLTRSDSSQKYQPRQEDAGKYSCSRTKVTFAVPDTGYCCAKDASE